MFSVLCHSEQHIYCMKALISSLLKFCVDLLSITSLWITSKFDQSSCYHSAFSAQVSVNWRNLKWSESDQRRDKKDKTFHFLAASVRPENDPRQTNYLRGNKIITSLHFCFSFFFSFVFGELVQLKIGKKSEGEFETMTMKVDLVTSRNFNAFLSLLELAAFIWFLTDLLIVQELFFWERWSISKSIVLQHTKKNLRSYLCAHNFLQIEWSLGTVNFKGFCTRSMSAGIATIM